MSVNRLMDEREASELLGCSVAALRKWRFQEKGPAYVNIGRLVRYSEADLNAYVDANRKLAGAAR